MTLAPLLDFELRLLDPCMAMTSRGVRVDEARRLAMIRALDDEVTPIDDELQRLVVPLLEAHEEALKRARQWHLFVEKWTCPCCRGGAKKRLACWACAGLAGSPTKKVLRNLKTPLGPCRVCEGDGKRERLVYNYESGPQTLSLLYKLLKLPKRMADGKLRADEEALKGLLAHDESGVVERLLRVRRHATIRSLLERVAPGTDGRIRTFYDPGGTETGRFNSRESFLEVSTNLQNLPKRVAKLDPMYDVRRCLVPDEGCALVEVDLSQAEARVVAALCNDVDLLARWEDPTFDVHLWTASVALDKPLATVTKLERTVLGKPTRHAGNYGMSWRRHMQNVNAQADLTGLSITAPLAKASLDRYHAVSDVQGWWHQVADVLARDGTITTCFGRRRMFFGRRRGDNWLDDVHKEAIAYEPQSTVADLLNHGLLRWWDRHEGRGGRLLMQVHDAIVVQVASRRLATAARQLKRCLEVPITVNGIALTIPADVSASRASLAEMEELEL